MVLKILVISAWFVLWLVNCIRFSWIIVGSFILIKLLAYAFFLEYSSPSLISVIQNILISNSFYQGNSCLLREICVLSGSLSEIPCANYFIIIIFYEVFLYLFPNQFFPKSFFAFWRKKSRRHLVKGVLL